MVSKRDCLEEVAITKFLQHASKYSSDTIYLFFRSSAKLFSILVPSLGLDNHRFILTMNIKVLVKILWYRH